MTTAKERAKEQIRSGASVLFAHALYKRPTLTNCKKLAQRLGVPVVVKLPSAQQRLVEKLLHSSFASNGVKKPATAAVQWFARQVQYIGIYITSRGLTMQCFVVSEREEDILFSSYFNKAAHDDALLNEGYVQAYLKEIEELSKEDNQ